MSETQTSLKFKDRLKNIRKPFNQEMLDNFFHLLEINQANDDKYDPKNHTEEEAMQYEKVSDELSAKWEELEQSIGKSINPEQVLDLKKKQWRKEEETAFNYKYKDGFPENTELMLQLQTTAQSLLDAYNNNSYSDSKLAQNYFSAHSEPEEAELRHQQHEEDYDLVSVKNKTILEQRWVNLEKALGRIYSLEEALAWTRDLPLDEETTKKFYKLVEKEYSIRRYYGEPFREGYDGNDELNKNKEDWIDLETLFGRSVTEKEVWDAMKEIWIKEENKDFNSKFNTPSFNKLSPEDQEYAIMSAFLHITYSLEPEVLYMDGEATKVEIEPVLIQCNHRWKNLEAKLGHVITNEDVWIWEKSEQDKENARKKAENKMKIVELPATPTAQEETPVVQQKVVENKVESQPVVAVKAEEDMKSEKKTKTKKEEVKVVVPSTPTTPEGKKKYLGFSLRRN